MTFIPITRSDDPPFVAHDGVVTRADRMGADAAHVITACAACLLFEALREREGR